jgi:predicted Zn-dependent protease
LGRGSVHEIPHVIRRDWARRYMLQKSVEDGRASQIVLGTVAVSSGAWVDPMGSSAWVASCNRLMELEADAGSLTLMAQAGFHPDFVPALCPRGPACSAKAGLARSLIPALGRT